MKNEVFFAEGALVPWPQDPTVECCANCVYGNDEEHECMNTYHPCEFQPRG